MVDTSRPFPPASGRTCVSCAQVVSFGSILNFDKNKQTIEPRGLLDSSVLRVARLLKQTPWQLPLPRDVAVASPPTVHVRIAMAAKKKRNDGLALGAQN